MYETIYNFIMNIVNMFKSMFQALSGMVKTRF